MMRTTSSMSEVEATSNVAVNLKTRVPTRTCDTFAQSV